MRTKIVFVVLIWIICLILLAACGAGAQDANASGTQIVATFVARITQTAQAAEIDSWLAESDATDTPSADVTEEPTETDAPFSTATPDPNQQLLSKFRTVTVSKGNLYVRDGLGVPVQITKSGTDHDPIISSDGKKIVFYRGEGAREIFVVNADGSNEKVLINKKMLPVLGNGEAKFSQFRVGTHGLFFNTNVCGGSVCLVESFIIDVDTAKITEFASGLDGSSEVSPDEQYFSVVQAGQMDLYRLDGKIVHANLFPSSKVLPTQYWLPDSSGLIVFASGNALLNNYFVWRYTLKDNRAEQFPLEPAPAMMPQTLCSFSISSDRGWMLYSDSQGKSHVANLKNIQSQPYAWDDGCTVSWSPDSQHFASQTAIGSVDGTPPIKIDGHFIAWLDATHYLFSKGKNILDLQTYIAEVGKESAAAPTNFIWSPVYAVAEPTPTP